MGACLPYPVCTCQVKKGTIVSGIGSQLLSKHKEENLAALEI